MTTINRLDPTARQMLAIFQNNSAPICGETQKAIEVANTEKGEQLSPKELEKILIAQLPDRKSALATAKKACAGSAYHPDGTNANFLTQLISFRIEKEEEHMHVPQPPPPRRRDPLYSKFIMDNDAQCVLLFNARDVDENGRPLLMKAVVREGTNVDALDFSAYRTQGDGAPDVVTVGKNAAYIETKDVQETEFAFGDALVQVSLDDKGKELSRGVATRPENKLTIRRYQPKVVDGERVPDLTKPVGGPQVRTGTNLDQTPVVSFDERIRLDVTVKDEGNCSAWFNTRLNQLDTKLALEPGLIFEPDSTATVKFLNMNAAVAVPATDSFLLGSPGRELTVGPNHANWTLSQLLGHSVTRSTRSGNGSDTNNRNIRAMDLLYPDRDKITIAGGKMAVTTDLHFTADNLADSKICGAYSPLSNDGQRLCLELDAGFVTASKGASVKGWSVEAGIVGADGTFEALESTEITTKSRSGKMSFNIDIENAAKAYSAGHKVEIRVYNDKGIPAQRCNVALDAFQWGA